MNRIVIILVLHFAFCLFGYGQSLSEAKTLFNQGNFSAALVQFESLLKKDPNDVQLNIFASDCILNINGDKSKAVIYMERVVKQPKFPKAALYTMAEAYAQNYTFDKAIDYYYQYLENVSAKLSEDIRKRVIDCQTAQELMKFPVDISFHNMGPEVNSPYPDYNPYITSDESLLLFNSRRKEGSAKPEFDGYYPANVYQSMLLEGSFNKAEMLNKNVNSKFDDILVGMSNSASHIFIFHDDEEHYGDVFVSYRSGKTFQRKVPFDEINNIGTFESAATISPDGNAIVFASDRKGGFGGLDLYIIRKLPTGGWSEPQNLGSEVNSALNEDFPHFSADGNYLYFSSNGHPGMGGYDLFLTEWDPAHNVWTRPKNLGYPINTPRDDRTIAFNGEQTSAYLSTWREDSHGDLDIYRIDFGERHNLPALVRIQVPTGRPDTPFVNSEIKVTDEFDELVGIYRPHPQSGKYVMALNPGKYYLYMDADGYQPHSELMMISDYYAQAEQNIKVIRLQQAGK
ncbi:MAG: hypothetical protein EA392_02375 [Cryomorphaceae bacterium]|nr:MAG: hypothetical protein EA392_02375 [Cryomorphaceae bacterium]